jgi:hypothetical protein
LIDGAAVEGGAKVGTEVDGVEDETNFGVEMM